MVTQKKKPSRDNWKSIKISYEQYKKLLQLKALLQQKQDRVIYMSDVIEHLLNNQKTSDKK